MGFAKPAAAQASPKVQDRQLSLRDIADIVLIILLLAGVTWLIYVLRDPMTLPVRHVKLVEPLKRVTPQEARQTVIENLGGGFVDVDLRSLERALESLPWVEDASARREWPDTIAIAITERRPFARWGTESLLSDRAEVFSPARIEEFAKLPVLHGPPGQEKEVLTRYHAIQAQLAPHALSILALAMDPRHAWRLLLNTGIPVELGRGQLDERIQRLVQVYPRVLAPRANGISRIDLRYTNGLAVAWKPTEGREGKGEQAS